MILADRRQQGEGRRRAPLSGGQLTEQLLQAAAVLGVLATHIGTVSRVQKLCQKKAHLLVVRLDGQGSQKSAQRLLEERRLAAHGDISVGSEHGNVANDAAFGRGQRGSDAAVNGVACLADSSELEENLRLQGQGLQQRGAAPHLQQD